MCVCVDMMLCPTWEVGGNGSHLIWALDDSAELLGHTRHRGLRQFWPHTLIRSWELEYNELLKEARSSAVIEYSED